MVDGQKNAVRAQDVVNLPTMVKISQSGVVDELRSTEHGRRKNKKKAGLIKDIKEKETLIKQPLLY